MDIYIVQAGDTIYSIADKYGVTVAKLIKDNGLENPDDLVTGQTIVIAYPKQIYIVKEGDTLISIADAYNVTYMQLLRNNPYLLDRQYIYPGETLVISYNTNGAITTLGFTYPYIKIKTLIKTLPNLTYLSVFNYRAIEEGDILAYYDDTEIIQLSKEYGTIPLMMVTTLTPQGEPNIEVAYSILISEEYQERHINNLLRIMKDKGYLGLNIVFRYLNTSNQVLYKNFIHKISSRLHEEGFLFFATISLNIEYVNNEIHFEKVDYTDISQNLNGIILLEFVWGTNTEPPTPVSNISNIRAFLDYITPQISSDKILIGTTVISYDWQLPYIPGSSIANSISLDSTITLARDTGSIIQFDETSQTPFFTYNQINIGPPFQHIVWSIDARSILALTKAKDDYALNGVAIWNIMIFYPQLWLLANSQYDVIKYLPYN